MYCRRDHDDGQVVDRGDGAWRDTCGEQLRRQGILVEEVAQQVGGDPAVGDHGDRPGCVGQGGEECLQPCPGLPGGLFIPGREVAILARGVGLALSRSGRWGGG